MHGNLLDALPPASADEVVDPLVSRGPLRIERIVSFAQKSPDGFWYDQPEHEFVVLLSGHATLAFDDGRTLDLTPGAWIDIPAHCKHRVDATAMDEATVWLAVFWGNDK